MMDIDPTTSCVANGVAISAAVVLISQVCWAWVGNMDMDPTIACVTDGVITTSSAIVIDIVGILGMSRHDGHEFCYRSYR